MAGYHPLATIKNNGVMQGGDSAGGLGADHYKREMLVAVQTGNEGKLVSCLKQLDPKDVNHVFGHPESGTALHQAVINNASNIVTKLLDYGADPNISDLRGKNYCAIHYAVRNGNANILRCLLDHHANSNKKETEFRYTSLHLLAKHWDKQREGDFKNCLDALLKKGVKADVKDSRGVTPLFLAALKGWEYMVRTLIYKGADLNSTDGVDTAKELIEETFPGLLDTIDYQKVEVMKPCFEEELFEALLDKDIDVFKTILKNLDNSPEAKTKASIVEHKHGKITLLEYACDKGLVDFVEVLLDHGANPCGDESGMSPLLYAARNGYHKIIELLIKTTEKHGIPLKRALRHSDESRETALHKVVKASNPKDTEEVNYYDSLMVLLRKEGDLDIDAKDMLDNTALHYAVLCDDQRFVMELLRRGARLGISNKFGTLAITRIKDSILEEVLNECIRHENKIADNNFEIILNYRMLAPPTDSWQVETECLRFMSGSKKHCHLLRHPVIDTFLFLKWQKIKPYFAVNVALYIMYLILLTLYILLYHSTYIDPENTQVNSTASGGNGSSDASLGQVKEVIVENLAVKYILKALIGVFTLYIAVREGVQFSVDWCTYLSRPTNWIEAAVVVVTFLLLFVPMSAAALQNLAAWAVLLSWIGLILLLGGYPDWSVYVTMFTTVTYNFFIFILMFSIMIVAFSISFFLLFQGNEHFATYQLTIMKTIAMATGEIEYTDLPLSDFPVSGHILFLLFVFLIMLVLMNLLVGLAVSDIQQIKQEAEIVSYKSRVDLISYIESVFLATPFRRILPGPVCCENTSEDCCLVACCESRNPLIRLLNWMGRKTLMFRSCLASHTITLYPNKDKKHDRWRVCECHSFSLKEAQIEAARDVVLEKEHSVTDQRLSNLESRVEDIIDAITTLADKVNRHVLCPSPE